MAGLPMIDRFCRHVERQPNGCYYWTGANDGRPGGYGRIWIPELKRTVSVHRWWYEFNYGALPPEINVRHSCDHPPCVYLVHLEPGTTADNMRDRDQRGRHGNTRKTHCPAGHAYDAANTYVNPITGNRLCRKCNAAHHRKGN
jgi:hypothetical protein